MQHLLEEKRRDLPRRFRSGPTVPGHQVQYDEAQCAWIIDQVLLPCSVAEYRCLRLLLESIGRCVSFASLFVCLPETAGNDFKQERMRLARVMSTLRARLWPLGFDIGSVMAIGYILMSGVQESESLPLLPPCPGE
jgi:DNA-binding response OmpR family regulator